MKNLVLSLTLFSAMTAPLLAVSQDENDYVKTLEQRLMALEQKLYSSEGSSGTATGGTMMADFEVRLQQIEEETQKVYGAVEELGHQIDTFAKKMDLISKDIDLRLTDLETSLEDGAMQPKADVADKKAEPAKKEMAKKEEAKPVAKAEKAPAKKVVKKAEAPKSAVPAGMSAEDHYSKAYNFLVATAYDDAEAWLKEFIKRHPTHNLADNAHYWLGEVYLVQDNLEKAVVSFSTGLSKFPKGAKAPANLLKMGTAFKRMKKLDFATSSWKKLIHDFKESSEAKKAQKELDKLKVESTGA